MPDYILWSQSKSSSSIYTHFSCFCNFFTLNQFNNVANNMGKLLDLVLSNGSCCVTKANDILLREDKYHPALHIVICAEFWENFPTSTRDSYNFKKADFRGLYLALSHVDWTVLDSIPNPDEGVDLLGSSVAAWLSKTVLRGRGPGASGFESHRRGRIFSKEGTSAGPWMCVYVYQGLTVGWWKEERHSSDTTARSAGFESQAGWASHGCCVLLYSCCVVQKKEKREGGRG
jgi:hypothetical protein